MVSDTTVFNKFLVTLATSAIVSDDMVELEGEAFVIQVTQPGLIQTAIKKIEELYPDIRTYAIHRDVKLKHGYLHPDDFIKGKPEVWLAVLKTDVYTTE